MGKRIFDKQFPGTSVTYKEKLIELVNKGMSGKQISNVMNIDYSNMHQWLRKLGINLPNYHNELKFDNTVFDSIDTEEKAYWLGFLYADGYVKQDGNSVELSLNANDAEHLEKFRKFLNYKNEVKFGKAKCNNKTFYRCRVTVTDKHFHNTLIDKGCVPNKSLILTFPDKSIFTSEELLVHFVRGYVDGDGSITFGCTNYAIFEIIGTKEFLEEIVSLYPNIFNNVCYKNKRHPQSNTYSISTGAKKSAIFGNLLYSNATVFLQRKYDKFIKYKYDEREHLRRVHSFSERKQLYYSRGRNRSRQNLNSD